MRNLHTEILVKKLQSKDYNFIHQQIYMVKHFQLSDHVYWMFHPFMHSITKNIDAKIHTKKQASHLLEAPKICFWHY